MNNKIKIRVYINTYKFIDFLMYNKIYFENLIKGKNYYQLTINYNDIKLLSNYKIEVINYYGINAFKNFLKYNTYVLIGIFSSLITLILLTQTIFDIKINTNNSELKSIINKSLYENDISIYKKKKSFNELQQIKKKILYDNKDCLEWIEIIENGTDYIIEITERKENEPKENINIPTNIVANKDGLIMNINLISGVQVREINDYVKKGDVIITGNIYKNDKLVNQVTSNGTVYAEVWYVVDVNVPYTYTEYVDTNEIINRYYIKLFDKEFTILGKYNGINTMNDKKIFLSKPYLLFDIYKEEKKIYEYKTFTIGENEAYNEALLRSENNINRLLDEDEYIMYKKVLKKEVFRSRIILEVFFKVYENITSTFRIEEVNNDS